MIGCVSQVGWAAAIAAMAMSLCAGTASAGARDHTVRFVQTHSETSRDLATTGQAQSSEVPTELGFNSPEQIRKAQIELQRMDCLKGRVDGGRKD